MSIVPGICCAGRGRAGADDDTDGEAGCLPKLKSIGAGKSDGFDDAGGLVAG
jgi:hypothetical protein